MSHSTFNTHPLILEVDEDIHHTLAGEIEVLEPVCQVESPVPILDGRLHKALMYLSDIKVHYGPTLWVAVNGCGWIWTCGKKMHKETSVLSGTQGRSWRDSGKW